MIIFIRKSIKFFTIIFVLLFLFSCGKKSEDTIVVGIFPNFPPFEYLDNGELVGLDVDIMNLLAKKINKKVIFKQMQSIGIMFALQSNKIDAIISAMTITEERKKQVDFTEPYFTSKQVIIVKKNDNSIKNVEDLKIKKIGVQLATTGDLFISNFTKNKVQFNSGAVAVMGLNSGRVDAVVLDKEPAVKLVKNYQNLKILDILAIDESYGIAVNKNNRQLLSELNKALKEIKNSGELKIIEEKYFK